MESPKIKVIFLEEKILDHFVPPHCLADLETKAQGNQVTYPRSYPELMAEEKLELMSSNTQSFL